MDKLFWSVWSWLWNDSQTNSNSLTTSSSTTTAAAVASSSPIITQLNSTTLQTPPTIEVLKNNFTLLPAINLTELTTTSVSKLFVATKSSPPTVEIRSIISSTPSSTQSPTIVTSATNSTTSLSRRNSTIPTVTEILLNSFNSVKNSLELTIDHHQQQKQHHYRSTTTQSESITEIDSSTSTISDFSSSSSFSIAAAEATTENLKIPSKFSSILDYDSVYNTSTDFFSNITSISSVNNDTFNDDVFIGGGATEEFLLDAIFNCTNLNDNNRDTFTAISFVRNNNSTTIINCTETENAGGYDFETAIHLITIFGTATILGIIILATVIGNVFVIAAILLERNLQSVANYLILSLAVADLLVACLVMPLSAVYEVSKEWKLGPELCDMWTSCDVLCCTASILHLVAIALDRYWAVTNIDYIHQRTARRIGVMILIIWALSFLVSIAPLLGWKDPKWDERVSKDLQCIVSQDIGYQIFATASSFYVPLLVILVLYWRIFQTARKRIRRRQQAVQTHPEPLANASCLALTAIGFRWKVTATQPTSGLIATAAGGSGGIAAAVVTVIGRPLPTISETTTAFTNISSAHTSPEKGSYGNGVDRIENDPPTADVSTYGSHTQASGFRPTITRKKTQTSVDSKRERKAAKTLAIITGAFVCCWLPFFILAILLPTCQCDISPLAMSLSLWLGYFNSTLNPIIYTIFSPEFRHAFKRILCGRRNSIRRRTRCVRR